MSLPLLEHVRRFAALTPQQEQRVAELTRSRSLKKREHLFASGDVCKSLAFVQSGLLRLYSVSDSGGEKTLQFGLEGWWLADFDAFARKLPSEFSLQAVEATEVTLIERDAYDELFDAVPPMERYFRSVYQRGYSAALRRIHMNESKSAAERYQGFLKAYPDFVDRVPQYMLASFLGFTPEFLSKLRGRKA